MFVSDAMQVAQDQQRLMSEGMTAAECADALDAAAAEGRRVGSAVEERQRAFDQAARQRREEALAGTGALAVEPGIKNVLIIDGTGASSSFMSEALLLLAGDAQRPSEGKPTNDEQRRAVEASLRTWEGLRHERLGLEGGERPDRFQLCRRAISSGRFHALILSDLSDGSRAIPAVERELGPTLRRFVQGGGAIAVTTCDAAMTLPMLQRLFGLLPHRVGPLRRERRRRGGHVSGRAGDELVQRQGAHRAQRARARAPLRRDGRLRLAAARAHPHPAAGRHAHGSREPRGGAAHR